MIFSRIDSWIDNMHFIKTKWLFSKHLSFNIVSLVEILITCLTFLLSLTHFCILVSEKSCLLLFHIFMIVFQFGNLDVVPDAFVASQWDTSIDYMAFPLYFATSAFYANLLSSFHSSSENVRECSFMFTGIHILIYHFSIFKLRIILVNLGLLYVRIFILDEKITLILACF